VAHACNHSYLGDEDQEDLSSRDPIFKITIAKWTGRVVQVVQLLLCKGKAMSSTPVQPKKKKKERERNIFIHVNTNVSLCACLYGYVFLKRHMPNISSRSIKIGLYYYFKLLHISPNSFDSHP
jgi:hypothetical protein